jgi:hypothetical protein
MPCTAIPKSLVPTLKPFGPIVGTQSALRNLSSWGSGEGTGLVLAVRKALPRLRTYRMARQFEGIESRDDQDWKADMKLTCKNANGCKIAVYRPGFS